MDLVIFFIIFWIGSKILVKFGFKTKPIFLVSITLAIIGSIILIIAYMLYALLSHSYVRGIGMSLIPALIGLVTLLCAAFLITRKQDTIIVRPITNLPFYSWALFAVATLIIGISKYGFLLSIYSPVVFKSNVQIPHIGVGIFVIGYIFAALILYAFSRLSYIKSPMLTFWISYIVIIYCFYQVTLYTLLLTYALIEKYNVSYPFLSSIMVFGYLPLVLILFIITLQNGLVTRQE